jgi:cytochrome P450
MPPEPEDYGRLPYTRAVVAEAMRLFPPAWVIGREARTPFEIGGYRVPAGIPVLVSTWVIQRDPRFYEAPLEFRPERWTPEAEAERPRFAYLPFSSGPRKCIGEGFAWMEGVLVLATLARHWKARLTSDAEIPLLPLVTLRPRAGIPVVLERR